MAPRTALAAFLVALAVTAAAGAGTAPSCPVTASAGAISCYEGAVYNNMPTTGGLCTCFCGASASTADFDYMGASDYLTQAYVTGSSSCTTTYCTATFGTACAASVAFRNATYTDGIAAVVAALNETAPASSAQGTGAICVTSSVNCGAGALAPCLAGMPTSVRVTGYVGITTDSDGTAAASCSMGVLAATTMPGATLNFCNTNNWCAALFVVLRSVCPSRVVRADACRPSAATPPPGPCTWCPPP